jgi:hypothetical protein
MSISDAPIAFNMDLANGPTSERYCFAAAELLGSDEQVNDDPEFLDEEVRHWDDQLSDAGYFVHWDAGDVVVWDLRELSDEDRDAFMEFFDG